MVLFARERGAGRAYRRDARDSRARRAAKQVERARAAVGSDDVTAWYAAQEAISEQARDAARSLRFKGQAVAIARSKSDPRYS
eukprot:6187494-Pleurochrysis_carterae.AAC.1